MGLVAFFNWRTTSSQDQLDNLYKERDKTIEKLKAATKYNSTQDLLDKYGSPKPSPKQGAAGDGKKGSPRGQKPGGGEQRIYRMPPPTANIPRNQPQGPNSPSSPQQPLSAQSDGAYPPPNSIPPPPTPATPQQTSPNAEFAPNAFSDAPPQYAPNTGFGQSRWYDRMMDALLGEDETQAKNRIALICQQCRLVNGQAPPGTKSLEELGRWRCSACGAWNGVESETSRLVQQLADHNIANDDGQVSPDSPKSPDDVIKEDVEDDYAIANPSGGSSDRPTRVTNASLALDKQLEQDGEGSEDDEPRDARDDVDTPAKSTRSRRGGKKK